MKKIFLPILLSLAVISCKKENTDDTLADLIAKKDVKGLQAYREQQQKRIDSINALMENVDQNLSTFGVNQTQGIVSILPLELTNFAHYIELQGNVTTDQDVAVQPQMPGTLTLYVRQGQYVGAGQVIGRVADGGLADQLKQAQIQVSAVKAQLQQVKSASELAKITYEKQASLWRQKIGSEIQFLQAKTNYESSVKQVSAVQSQVAATQKAADAVAATLSKTAIRAPFSGVIDEVMQQTGQVVSPGMPIVKLINLTAMRVEAKVPETYLSNVKAGTSVIVDFPMLKKTINSRVRLTSNFINPANRTFTIQVPIANQGGIIKPNLLAKVKIEDYFNPNAIVVPSQYIYEDAAYKSFVFVAKNVNGNQGVAKKVFITKGVKSENSIEIKSGLNKGDILITDGSKTLVDGQKIKIQ
ncbi:MAG: efflux RND transporter periplasmic adaptor subunit [Cloacibacterium caeni]